MPRNSSGTYTLPAGNPVVSGTLIESVWANNTLSDVASSLTNSLDRTGFGAMLAALKGTAGSALAPAFTFSVESSTGMYWAGAGQLGFSILGLPRLNVTAAGVGVVGAVSVSGDISVGGALNVTGGLNVTGDISFLGTLGIPAGTALLPGLHFNGDPNTGLYSPAADTLALATTGAARLHIDLNGAVRLFSAASSPTLIAYTGSAGQSINIIALGGSEVGNISFRDSSGAVDRLRLYSDAAISVVGNEANLPMVLQTSSQPRLRIEAGGFVGIGAGVPTSELHVKSATASVQFQMENSSYALSLQASGQDGYFNMPGTGKISFRNGAAFTERMVVDAVGNVGIGVAPAVKLDVGGSVAGPITARISNAGSAAASRANLALVSDGGTFNIDTYSLAQSGGPGETWLYTETARAMVFGTTSLPRMRITPAGQLLIGTTTAVTALTVQGSISARDGDYNIFNSGAGGRLILGYEAFTANGAFNLWTAGAVPLTFGTLTVERMRIDAAGAVGIGAASLGSKLEVTVNTSSLDGINLRNTQNGLGFSLYANGTASAVGSWNNAGVLEASGATGGLTLSAFNGPFVIQVQGRSEKLRIIADGTITDFRGLTLARDPGATAPPTVATAPIGSIVVANGGAGNVNALSGTRDGSTLIMRGLNAGANTTLTTGTTWRCIGALDSSSTNALWIRIA